MGYVTYCLMCLGTDVKMYRMNSSMLTIYNELVLNRNKINIKHMYACYECAHLLHKYAKFKSKCCTAYNILWNLSPGSFKVTDEDFKNIDRKQNKLQSLLTVYTSTSYYQTIQDCRLANEIKTQKIKRESSGNSIEQSSENTIRSAKKLEQPSIVTTTLYTNNPSQIYKEYKSNTKITLDHDIEDDYQSVDCSNFNSNEQNVIEQSVKFTRQCSDLEHTEIYANKVDLESPITLNIVGCDSNHDSSSDNNPEEFKGVNSKENILILEKNDSFESLILDSHGNKTRAPKIGRGTKVQIKADHRLTLDSSFFRDYMTIIKLTREDARSELLLRKDSRNYRMNLQKCDLCYRGFITEATYEAHMKKHSLDYGTIKCDICQLSFSESRSLSRHWAMCHTWKLLCKACPYICFNINQAKSHIQSHKGKKYTCKDCGESFRFPNSLSTHMRLKHSIELVCEFCGSTFASAQGMDCHKRLRHRKEKNELLGPQCEECDVHFASELAWKRHRVLCSRHEVRNGCVVCGETFSSRVEMKSHSREHGEPTTTAHSRSRKLMEYKPLPCEICNKELHSRKAYVKHVNAEHPQIDTGEKLTSKCVCEVCGRTFRHRSFLIAHQRKHTDEKPFGCPHCGKKFKNAYAVKMHLPMHTNEYSFKCHLCDKAFGDRGRLNRHIKGHLGIRPYKCSYCDRTFMFQCEERLHTKYVHCKEPYPKRDRSKRNAAKKNNIK